MKKYLIKMLTILTLQMGMVFFSNSFSVFSQRIEQFSNLEGFNQNTVNTLEQDSYGFLWIGTPNGLIKYDGYDFKNVDIDFNSHITNLYNDKNNMLWIGHFGGLHVNVISLEKTYKVPIKGLININNIVADNDGNIWVSGENKLYVCKLIDPEKGIFEISENLIREINNIEIINQFYFNKNNNLIVATHSGLFNVDIEYHESVSDIKIKKVSKFEEFEDDSIIASALIDDTLWLSTTNGLYKTSVHGKKIHVLKKIELPNIKGDNVLIKKIFKDSTGIVWIGTQNIGLLKYLPETETVVRYQYQVDKKDGISSNIINCFFEDHYGILWIGTAQGGLNKLNTLQKNFINYTHNPYKKQSISGNLTTSILEDSKGYLWVSTYNNSLCRSLKPINDKTVHNISFKKIEYKISIPKQDVIRSLFEDNKGYIWIGTDHYVLIYNPKTDQFKRVLIKYNNKRAILGICSGITQLDDNHILLGGSNVVILENPWKNFSNQKDINVNAISMLLLDNNKIYSIMLDSNKKLWLGTHEALLQVSYHNYKLSIYKKFDHNTANEFKENQKSKLNFDKIFSLKEDIQGNILVGTFGNGLNKLYLDDEGEVCKIDVFNKDNLLIDNAVYGVLEDKEGDLWLSTDMGICKLNLNDSSINVFDVRDGLLNNNFRKSSYYKGKSGYYYFGGLKGLTVFKSENITLNTIPPKVVITGLKVKNKTVEIHQNQERDSEFLLKKSILETKEITIHQNDQIVALDVAVQHSAVPSKNKLAYKLEGFNDDWIEENNGKTTITYTNLSQGDYVLKIKGANSDGIWNEKATNLNIKVLPPWYKTWWSYVIFGLILIASTSGIFIYFIRIEKLQQRLKYEELDKERISIANQNKFRFFTNISHEFRTPLSLISGPLERVIEQNSDDKNAKYLAIIQKNTKRLLTLVDQLITFRQAEQGHINLNLTKTTLGDFIYPITDAFEDYALEKNINFFFKVNEPNEEIVIDIEKTERILFNLLSNSFKNTPQKGSISIEALVSPEGEKNIIHFDVVDSGKGIPKENLENIFERFYQLGNKGDNVSGGGIGLAFCKSLTTLLGGEISVESTQGVETRFSVTIPSKIIDESNKNKVNTEAQSFIKEWVPLTNIPSNENIKSTEAGSKKYDVLLVEDEEDVQSFLVESLSYKYNITVANNGVEGLEKLKNKEPHIILSDVMMQEMDGFQFCKTIKENADTCHIPVVLLTALGEIEDTVTGLELGADEYISKPFSLKELTLRIDKLVKITESRKEHFSKNSSLPDESDQIEISVRDKEFINTILTIMEENIGDSSFGVEELSTKVGLSTSHFYRKLKKLTGQIPNAYLRNYRLNKAAEMLSSNEGLNVSEVMYSIGIESNSYFSTSFKKLHGVSPSEFLKRNNS